MGCGGFPTLLTGPDIIHLVLLLDLQLSINVHSTNFEGVKGLHNSTKSVLQDEKYNDNIFRSVPFIYYKTANNINNNNFLINNNISNINNINIIIIIIVIIIISNIIIIIKIFKNLKKINFFNFFKK